MEIGQKEYCAKEYFHLFVHISLVVTPALPAQVHFLHENYHEALG